MEMTKSVIPRLRNILVTMLVIGGVCTIAVAEEPIATELDTSDAEGFIAPWLIEFDLMGQEIKMVLTISDVEGKVGATLDSDQQPEPLAITSIEKNAAGTGLDLQSELNFGGFKVNIGFLCSLDGDELVGTVKELSSDFFEAEFRASKVDGKEGVGEGDRPSPTEARARFDGKIVRIVFGNISTSHADYQGLANAKPGEIFTYTSAGVTKMFTDLDLNFDGTIVKTGNVAPDYPGVYGLWLKKTEDGWSLVFNHEADTWGTRHNPDTDAAEVPLATKQVDTEQEEFRVRMQTDGDAGIVTFAWGATEWSSEFKVVH